MTMNGASPMKILALEFSSHQRSVAVVNAHPDGGPVIAAEVVETGPGAMRALGMVESALREANLEREQIECLAVGLGPGSYTGIRAAISLAQGWQLALGVRLLGISSADAIAAQAQADGPGGPVSVVIDAQRDELYLAGYQIGPDGWKETAPLRLVSRNDAAAREQAGDLMAGPEVNRWFPRGKVVIPRAATVGRLALGRTDSIAGEELEPIYLRETQFVKAPTPRMFV